MPDRSEILRALTAEGLAEEVIKAVAVREGFVSVTLAVDGEVDRKAIGRRVEQTLRRLEGVKEVSIHFTVQPGEGRPATGPPVGPIEMPGVRDIIAVGAGKGGVGKSTLAVHIAVGLRRGGAAVGLLDADVYGPSVATMVGIAGLPPQSGVGRKIRPFEAAGIKVVSMANFVQPGTAMIWRGPMVHGVVRQFLGEVEWGELDYLVVDLPPGTGDVPLSLAQSVAVTGAVVVTTPQPVALDDALRATRMYQQLGIAVLGLVENMSYFTCPQCGAEHDLFGRGAVKRSAEALGLALLGEIPMSPSIRTNTDSANAEADFDDDGPVGEAVRAVVGRLVDQIRIRRGSAPPPRPLAVR